MTGIRIFFPQHFSLAYGIIDNVCIDAWSSTVATGLVSLSLSLSLSLSVVDKAPPLCKKLSFKCVFVVRSSDGIKWNIFPVLLLVTCCMCLPTVIGDKKEKPLFSREKLNIRV